MYDRTRADHSGTIMQIQVNVDHELLKQALEASDPPTQAAVIEHGLRMVICLSKRTNPEDMFGLLPEGINHPARH